MNLHKCLITIGISLGLAASNTAVAQVQALKVGLAGDRTDVSPIGATSSRLVEFRYRPDRSFAIRALANEFVTLEAPEGESIVSFVISDAENWEHTVMKDNRRVLVKAVSDGAQVTTGQLVTDKRSYPLTFIAVSLGQPWFQRVRWQVSAESVPGVTWRGQAAPAQIGGSDTPVDVPTMDPEKLHFGYRVKGRAAFRPSTVFDDGVRTWILLDEVQDLPAVFGSVGKKLEVLDYSIHGKYMVVPVVSKQLTLKLRHDEVTLERTR